MILSIESSCDDSSIAITDIETNELIVVSLVISNAMQIVDCSSVVVVLIFNMCEK